MSDCWRTLSQFDKAGDDDNDQSENLSYSGDDLQYSSPLHLHAVHSSQQTWQTWEENKDKPSGSGEMMRCHKHWTLWKHLLNPLALTEHAFYLGQVGTYIW